MSEAGEFEDEDEIDKTKLQLQLPRVFIGGKYIGGAEEVKQLHETGELKKFVERLPAVTGGVCALCGDFRLAPMSSLLHLNCFFGHRSGGYGRKRRFRIFHLNESYKFFLLFFLIFIGWVMRVLCLD
ncbi:putative glutaredoxin, Thioredoxin-like superfamily [Helianthus annuus]|uniref:Glutaredoxin, Thioredoxin-like superfamily n=1 Tax=Helianthus annuus TaxID=4232 RepID=A0A9K3II97_HELAN|nr:putative glutaredoxin, Thioredoxin-like superfamily [Helianthus annuus]KAJ0720455.1 putative Thioredoxin-like superfamily [Helianthus annuus]KAJ0723658.1 putative Thioredoxin-like superfamily [Helianthus annuus]KAJ0903078.1 putative glutaredoxin, Thioredoxin-like superfamily [Helianthus annuus]